VARSGGVSVMQPLTVRNLESAKCWSEWQDLNLRPPRPERGVLPDRTPILAQDPADGPRQESCNFLGILTHFWHRKSCNLR
jgi:hypothetical protein